MRDLNDREMSYVNFMLNHLKTIDDKTDIIIKASNGILALIVGIVAFLIAFASHKINGVILFFVFIPIALVLISIIFALLLLYPKFTQLVFFEKEEFPTIESRYYLSLKKKISLIRYSVFALVFAIISFAIWFMVVIS